MSSMQTQEEFILVAKGRDYEGMYVNSFDGPLDLARYALRTYAWNRMGPQDIIKFLQAEIRALEEE